MLKFVSLFTLVLVASLANSQTTENRKLSAFEKVDISGSLDAVLVNGNDESVKIESSSMPIANIITEVKGNALYVYIDNKNKNYHNSRVKVFITCKNLVSIHKSGSGNLSGGAFFKAADFDLDMSGSGNIILDGSIQGKDIRFNKSGSGNIKVGSIEADNVTIVVSGSGNTDIPKGTTKKQTIRLSGSGNIKMADLDSEESKASISGSGDIEIRASKTLDGKIAGSGNILYHGNAQVINSTVSGSGRIHKKS
jgi:hypothetical protein